MRPLLVVAVTGIACFVLPSAAGASSTVGFTDRFPFNGTEFASGYNPSYVSVVGDAGASVITAEISGDSVVVTDTSGVTAAKGCSQMTATSAGCPRPDTGKMALGAGDDRADLALGVFGAKTSIDGGPGNDVLNGPDELLGEGGADILTVLVSEQGRPEFPPELYGGDGDDQLNGSPGDDELHGGRGSDRLEAGAGNDTLDGDHTSGSGEDDVLDAGEGSDLLDWGERNSGVVVNLVEGEASGKPGERDSLTGFEAVETGSGDDKLTGTSAGESFNPSDGKDVVVAGGGDDTVEAGELGLEPRRSDTYLLGRGDDWISYWDSGATGLTGPITVNLADPGPDGPPGALDKLRGVENVRGSLHRDRLIGNGRANILLGEHHHDFLDGRKGEDTLSGGFGGDTIRAKDGAVDLVNCGAGGSDSVRADPVDEVKRCEKRG